VEEIALEPLQDGLRDLLGPREPARRAPFDELEAIVEKRGVSIAVVTIPSAA